MASFPWSRRRYPCRSSRLSALLFVSLDIDRLIRAVELAPPTAAAQPLVLQLAAVNRQASRRAKADTDAAEPEKNITDTAPPKNAEPLNPFVPSETIPADQGVDFPYDI